MMPAPVSLRRLPLVSLVLLSLTGCAFLETALAPAPPQVAAPAPAPAPVQQAVQPAALPKAPPPPKPKPSAAAVAEPGIEKPILVGKSAAELSQILGMPSEEIEAAPGKVWRYQSRACSLDVHLFFDVARGDFYALEYRNALDNDKAAAESCVNRLRKDHQSASAKTSG
ncbi:hypothetical protein [Telmatospirillum sp. J64-1]|uniref:hypothetical protein n=1 Tax=Telmatospirillum sp. J64-1 TaxID=2502183 RepID=UPI00115E16CC|nr:hypothetical protein [Telmatospirillum sp. J64-1]